MSDSGNLARLAVDTVNGEPPTVRFTNASSSPSSSVDMSAARPSSRRIAAAPATSRNRPPLTHVTVTVTQDSVLIQTSALALDVVSKYESRGLNP